MRRAATSATVPARPDRPVVARGTWRPSRAPRRRASWRAREPLDRPAAPEEVPDLDDVPLRIADEERRVAAVVLLRPAHVAAVRLQTLLERVEPARRRREGEVDVGAALVAELLAARRPQ